jgi:hypothetical protein
VFVEIRLAVIHCHAQDDTLEDAFRFRDAVKGCLSWIAGSSDSAFQLLVDKSFDLDAALP